MYFLFSGEGATDLGSCASGSRPCEAGDFHHGPMAVIVDQIFEEKHKYSLLDSGCCALVAKRLLAETARQWKTNRKKMKLRGKKRPKETLYFYKNARALGHLALERQAEVDDDVVAVFFRDSDGTASAGLGQWDKKWQSILRGFEAEQFSNGVPMLPRPKSEAWILCAVKKKYQGCNALERRSGNDNSPKSLKKELRRHFGSAPTREQLCEMVADGTIDIQRIVMPSFVAFRDRLKEVI